MVYAKRKQIVIKRAPESFIALAGTFRVRKPIPAEQIRSAIVYSEKGKRTILKAGRMVQ